MKVTDNYHLTPLELLMSMFAMIIGIGILTVPRTLALSLNTADGWMSLILAGIISLGIAYLYVQIQKKHPGKTYLQFIAYQQRFKAVAFILAALFVLYFILLTSYEARALSLVVNLYLLDQTPPEVLVGLILICTTYAVSKGFQAIVHLNILFVPITLGVLLGIMSFNLTEFSFDVFLPLVPQGWSVPLMGIKETIFSFIGIEIILFFMGKMKEQDITGKPIYIALGFITLIYVAVTLLTYSVFSVDSAKLITFPTVELAKMVEIPGAFFERLESMMITVWIMAIFNTMAITQYLAISLLETHILSERSSFVQLFITFIIFLITFMPQSITEASSFGDYIGYLGMSLLGISLGLGYVVLILKHWKSNRSRSKGRNAS